MKVADLAIGNIYKDEFGCRIIYMGIISKGFYRDQHDFDSIDNFCGMICTDEEIEEFVTEV